MAGPASAVCLARCSLEWYFVAWLLLLVEPVLAKKKMGGSQKCEKGHFTHAAKDAAIALCDDHYPDAKGKAKNPWVIMFYSMAETLDGEAKDLLNRVAQDLGNEPPEKSKSMIKTKKQRTRIKDLGEKYEFEVQLPKKGPSGSDPLAKVGAVCCDCGTPPKVCEGRSGLFFVKAGVEESLASIKTESGDVARFALQKLGYAEVKKAEGEL
mmetsp:Transcript_31517/g.61907  ORF Transcript_31517/g.61907 Transcript_31517/m.61907 type:complete len:210 (+) Transcript_31517:58-687(+)|eukprot:CAMPEP_0172821190 /NCGR_PEP_ID=MMETSP1075-20121228/15774_1 /TAXON_ID=2916 /ORGANISM="Ceratium fusus, Strain PA161109" /LENGTH=209 /DNA_ID=CAMNT_0013661979 /DNA_START=46 /DNA_END=675 /DNA_ORIENTATION=-